MMIADCADTLEFDLETACGHAIVAEGHGARAVRVRAASRGSLWQGALFDNNMIFVSVPIVGYDVCTLYSEHMVQ
jgi:hypothetical protein